MNHDENGKPINLELINYKLNEMQGSINDINKKLEDKTVGRTEFELRVGRLEKLTYGAIGLGLLALGKAVIELVVK